MTSPDHMPATSTHPDLTLVRPKLSVPGAELAGMNVDVDHPDLIDLDTGLTDEYQWVAEPAGGGEPGYAHAEDHEFAWPREALSEGGARIAEVSGVEPGDLGRLRYRYANPPDDPESDK